MFFIQKTNILSCATREEKETAAAFEDTRPDQRQSDWWSSRKNKHHCNKQTRTARRRELTMMKTFDAAAQKQHLINIQTRVLKAINESRDQTTSSLSRKVVAERAFDMDTTPTFSVAASVNDSRSTNSTYHQVCLNSKVTRIFEPHGFLTPNPSP